MLSLCKNIARKEKVSAENICFQSWYFFCTAMRTGKGGIGEGNHREQRKNCRNYELSREADTLPPYFYNWYFFICVSINKVRYEIDNY